MAEPIKLSDVHSILIIGVTLIGLVVWSVRLESKVDAALAAGAMSRAAVDKVTADLQSRLDAGILPLTQERMNRLQDKIEALSTLLVKSGCERRK